MIAAGQGNQEAVDLLLRLGARKDLKDDVGKTALNYAVERGRTNVAQLLR
jgi:ankyrin repeat protein